MGRLSMLALLALLLAMPPAATAAAVESIEHAVQSSDVVLRVRVAERDAAQARGVPRVEVIERIKGQADDADLVSTLHIPPGEYVICMQDMNRGRSPATRPAWRLHRDARV